jgi:hypothetical protein
VRGGTGSECVEELGPGRRGRRPPGDRAVLGGAGRAGRRAGAALAGAPARPAGRSPCQQAFGGGARHRLVSIDRLPATLVRLRDGVTQDVLACWVRVPRSTITPAAGEVRRPQGRSRLHRRGRVRLPAQVDGVADLGGQRAARPLDAPGSRCATRRHTRPRDSGPSPARPTPRPPGALVLTDPAGRLLFCAQARSGAIHQLTQVCLAGRVELAASRASPCWLTPTIRGFSVQIAGSGRKRLLSRRRADQLGRPSVVVRIRRRPVDLVRCERAAVPAPAEALCGPVRRLGLVGRRDALLLHQEPFPAARKGVVN